MNAIVAVFSDWGIGKDGTQPIALSADRKFFRETTRGAAVIVGRRTAQDFPGQKPLPGRANYLLTREDGAYPGFIPCRSPEEAVELTKEAEQVFVIGGGSVYRQMLPCCDTAYVTKVGACPASDTFFPNLDEDEDWYLEAVLARGEEAGISYEMLRYRRRN